MKLSEIHCNPKNPRLIKDDKFKKLCQSIKDFPKMMKLRPIIIDTDGMILGGNMRFKALKELGYKEVPDEWIKRDGELTEAEKQRFIIADNIGFGEYDWDILANEWDKDDLIEWGLDIPDFAFKQEAVEDDYEIPDEIETDIVLGDLFEIGQHRLLCGDSTDSDSVAKLMNGQKADMVFTDMPYGIGKDGIENDNLKGDEWKQFNDDYISLLPVRSNAGFICYHSTRTFNDTINSAQRNGWKFEKMFFFYRPDKFPVHTWNGWMMTSQAILLFTKGETEYYSIKPAHQDVYTITSADLKDKNVKHPTVKPVAHCVNVMKHFVANSVYDPFIGSGSTMSASEQTNRKCYGMEIDPKYCQVIIDRMRKLDPDIKIKRNGKEWTPEG